MDSEEIIDKLQDKLRTTSWYNTLRWFLMSQDFKNIIDKLLEFNNEKRRFTPTLKDVFVPFEHCDYSKLKVIILFNEPYKNMGYANGFPISSSNILKRTPKFWYFENAVRSTTGNFNTNKDFVNLANQGVLLLNVSMTTDINKESKLHYKIWHPFITFLLDKLSLEKKYIFVFIGSEAEKYTKNIDDINPKFYTEDIKEKKYPNMEWDCNDVFNKVNTILINNHLTPIDW